MKPRNSNQPPILLTVEEAAHDLLRISTSLLYRFIREGKLPAYTMPGIQIVRIRREDAERFVAEAWQPVSGPIRPARGERALVRPLGGRHARR